MSNSEAFRLLDAHLRTDPDWTDGKLCAATILSLDGGKEAAIGFLRQSLDSSPDDRRVLLELGQYLQAVHDNQGAVECLERAIRLGHDDPEVHYELGCSLMLLQPEKALEQLDVVVEAWPQHSRVHFARGIALEKLGRYVEAERAYDSAIRWGQDCADYADYLGRQGDVALRLGALDEAEAAIRKAISLAPREPDYYETLADIYCRRRQYFQAKETLLDALNHDAKNARLL